MAKDKKLVEAITSMDEDFAQWYTDVVKKAELVDYTSVKGCMVIKPAGYAIWENIQHELDRRFKETGVENVYLPMFIPESLLQKEKDHVEGFAPEVAWVTHGGLEPLQERLCVRPTSETLFCDFYAKDIQSHRDLPKVYNQWCSVVRWEKTTRPFLRSREFLWQEGHTAHATREEAEAEAKKMLNVYADFAEKFMAVPVIKGVKSPNERFAGAVDTYCIEAMMQDGKALQAGTSHFLGQNFAKAFDVKFLSKENKLEYVWATSWGVSTRLMGALIMTHSDDEGLVLPPALAPIQVVIIPIFKTEEECEKINQQAERIKTTLEQQGISVRYDDRREYKPGWKFHEYEFKGVPLRITIGARDLAEGKCEIARRDTMNKELVDIATVTELVKPTLDDIQSNLYNRALQYRLDNTRKADTWEEFVDILEHKGGFISAHWDGTAETEEKIKELTKATIRCIPFDNEKEEGRCVYSGKPSSQRVIFAKAY